MFYLCFLFNKLLCSDGIIKSSYLMKCYNNTQGGSVHQPEHVGFDDFRLSETTDSIHIYQTSHSYSMLVFRKMGRMHGFFPEVKTLSVYSLNGKQIPRFLFVLLCSSGYRTHMSCNCVPGFLGGWCSPPAYFGLFTFFIENTQRIVPAHRQKLR